jgi:hypothetical protein
MNRSTLLMTALLGVVSLAACERETVVATPASPPVVASTDPAPTTVPVPVPVPVPGPAGPQGEPGKPGDQGPQGSQGAPGKPGDTSTVVIVPPAASAPTTN